MMDLACGVMNHGWLGHPPAEIWDFSLISPRKCWWFLVEYAIGISYNISMLLCNMLLGYFIIYECCFATFEISEL